MANELFDGLLGASPDSAPDITPDTAPDIAAPDAARNEAAPFARCPDGRVFSYADTRAASAQFAHVLTAYGVRKGDRVAVQVSKSIEAVFLYLGCIRIGAVFLPLNTAYTPAEVSYFLNDARPAVFICDPGHAATLREVAETAGARLETMGGAGSPNAGSPNAGSSNKGSVMAAAHAAPTRINTTPCAADDLAAILYTSGTTGRSKGAMLSHGNLLSNALTLRELWRFTADDVLLHALPIFHTHGLFVAINTCLVARASMVVLPAFDLDDVLRHLPTTTAMMGVPTFYTRLLGDDRFSRDAAAHMRLFISGSAPLLAETHIQFEERTGQKILERYGMTETNMNTSNPYDGERRAGTVGFPLPGVEVRICDAGTGATLRDGEIGVLEVRGPNVFSGYWQMPEKTAEEFRPDGFFITGDMARQDADGYIHIVGRSKDLIISGGYNIYPKEIELVLDDEDGVLESADIGTPHPDFGEAVVAVLVAEKNGLDLDALTASINAKLARFKQPKRIELVDELPRNTMGKVQKNILRDRYADSFTNG
ncbi:MAG: malonyl-CoA synthase [Alphaproteobacteria bacterium]|nr:malonyl-CoA synthase [Alphaproteobacteria bacterium]